MSNIHPSQLESYETLFLERWNDHVDDVVLTLNPNNTSPRVAMLGRVAACEELVSETLPDGVDNNFIALQTRFIKLPSTVEPSVVMRDPGALYRTASRLAEDRQLYVPAGNLASRAWPVERAANASYMGALCVVGEMNIRDYLYGNFTGIERVAKQAQALEFRGTFGKQVLHSIETELDSLMMNT